MSRGSTADIDPELWSIVDGKLYLNLNEKANTMWMEDLNANIEKAHNNWPSVIKGK